ncbi:hypothetical protein CLV84_0308 [Neolewinella xylanilytica]|uniref:Uncharacterized protein n=1 Tax=Neolewinella xylanilytica TaxID=1514080 RepID=A0A2S6I7C7_9BACT|nr:hypothetical protein [Neolewinella xylanilytica]PPK87368.1 hypothetical protein CLV84_0308 [Neolewinella xylanilytica]
MAKQSDDSKKTPGKPATGGKGGSSAPKTDTKGGAKTGGSKTGDKKGGKK